MPLAIYPFHICIGGKLSINYKSINIGTGIWYWLKTLRTKCPGVDLIKGFRCKSTHTYCKLDHFVFIKWSSLLKNSMVVLLVLPLNIRLYGSELVANTLAYNTSPLITTVKSFTVLAQVLTVQTQCLTRKNKKIILQDLLYMGLTITNTLAYHDKD